MAQGNLGLFLRKKTRLWKKSWFGHRKSVPKNFAAISWYDVTKITMVSKLTKTTIADICIRSCFLLQKKSLNVKIGYLLKMEGHVIDPTWYKIFLRQNWKLVSSVLKNSHPSLLVVNPLDYFYCDFVKVSRVVNLKLDFKD